MLIVVEGCVGVGKSTVAKGLAAHRNSGTLLEKFEQNPFLSAFYDDPCAHAIETEFSFLLMHFHQLKTHFNAIASSEVIADFHLDKDLLYAESNLGDSKAEKLFKELYDFLIRQVPPPTLMICLSANNDLLIQRIRQRKRDFELKLDAKYYADINAAYERFFAHYSGRKLRISMDDWDFLKEPELYRKLSGLIDETLQEK